MEIFIIPITRKFYSSNSLDKITIQLGENASNIETYKEDWIGLITYIKEKAPNAEIYVIGDFWSNGNRDELKEEACDYCNVVYISLDGIKDNSEYYAGIGTEVQGKDSSDMHIIEHEEVAIHPGDLGMKAIADRLIEKVLELQQA